MPERFADLLSRGATTEALEVAGALVAARRYREALLAHLSLSAVAPAFRGHCLGVAADLHVELGEIDAALRTYELARRWGVPADWIAGRVARLQALSPDVYVAPARLFVNGCAAGEGALVVRPHFVSFAPTGPHLSVLAASAPATPAPSATWARLSPAVGRDALVAHAKTCLAPELDHVFPEFAGARGGLVWTARGVMLIETKLPLGIRVTFVRAHERLELVRAKQATADATFQRLSRHYHHRS